jgi:hypothetical protein
VRTRDIAGVVALDLMAGKLAAELLLAAEHQGFIKDSARLPRAGGRHIPTP